MEDGSVALYEAVREEGERELDRPASSLWWSGIAAGLCMSTSVLASGFLDVHLPDAPWAPLLVDLGYTVGFVIVVLGQLQLFTENTITTVLPFLAAPSMEALWKTARLWAIVLVANLVGAILAAVVLGRGGILDPVQLEAVLQVAEHATSSSPYRSFATGVPAGFLIAAVVWLNAGSTRTQFSNVFLLTYLIALGDFAHVIAGSVEVALLVVAHGAEDVSLVGTFVLPALFGNIFGGTLLFSLLAYAQVREELPDA